MPAQVAQSADTGTLTAAIRIPDTVGALNVTADLRANQIIGHIDVESPREGRATTRVEPAEPSLVSSALSSQDGAEVDEPASEVTVSHVDEDRVGVAPEVLEGI
ncbi:hypothetical protein [Actinocrispum wychmicini]|uniref:hypothetical protein n=1 Tax=Actinocrispum wychmicini TaxID=1213861 RepID=UPI00104EE958|nr:hypothetical protein [Actinocrispum wychmicini]